MPAFSVVVPSYNHRAFVREAVESVFAQTYPHWELVVVDDASTDGSLDVLRELSHPQLRVEANGHNLGAYATLNRGIDLARHEWIAVLDSDDRWSPKKLELQAELIADHPECSWGYCAGEWMDEEGVSLGEHHDEWPRSAHQNLLPFLLDRNWALASGLAFRRGEARFREGLRYVGDWLALLQLAERSCGTFVSEPVVGWRQHPTNSYARLLDVFVEEIALREWLLARYAPMFTEGEADTRRRLAKCALHLSALYLLGNEVANARKWVDQSLRWDKSPSAAKRALLLRASPTLARRALWRQIADFAPFEARLGAMGWETSETVRNS